MKDVSKSTERRKKKRLKKKRRTFEVGNLPSFPPLRQALKLCALAKHDVGELGADGRPSHVERSKGDGGRGVVGDEGIGAGALLLGKREEETPPVGEKQLESHAPEQVLSLVDLDELW